MAEPPTPGRGPYHREGEEMAEGQIDQDPRNQRVVMLLQVLSVLGPALTDEQVQSIIKAIFSAAGLDYPEGPSGTPSEAEAAPSLELA